MQPLGLTTGILADDLTGACETALQFYLAGANSRIATSGHTLNQIQSPQTETSNTVWTVNTESRHHEPNEVLHEYLTHTVQTFKHQFGAEQFYKKMDSTLRGHIAQECVSLREGLEVDCVLIAPAYPEEGRQTVGGYQLVHSIPVEQSVMNRDPLSPVTESHIPSILAHTINPKLIGHIELKTVLDGAGPILAELQNLLDAGKQFIVVDACSRTDLDQIALAWVKAQKSMSCLPCGSAGLAQSLCKYWIDEPSDEQSTTPPHPHNVVPLQHKKDTFQPTPHVLMVAGSTTDTSRSQLSYLLKQATLTETSVQWVRPQPEELLGLSTHNSIGPQLTQSLKEGGITVLTTNETEAHVNQTLSLGEQHQLSDTGIHNRIQQQIKQWVSQAILNNPAHPLTIIAVGGETALSICQALNLHHATIVDRIDTQVPILKGAYQLPEQTAPSTLQFITKSGDLGDTHLLWHTVRHTYQPTPSKTDPTHGSATPS